MQLDKETLQLISSAARGMFIPSTGKKFACGDYSAVEARLLFFVTNCRTALDVYEAKEDLYCNMASQIYRREITKADKDERFFGKTSILSLGYGVGFIRFCLKLLETMRFNKEQAKEIIGHDLDKYFDIVYYKLFPRIDKFNPYKPEEIDVEYAFKKECVIAKSTVNMIKSKGYDVYDILFELAVSKYVVDLYRSRFKEVKQFWYDIEDAVKTAIKSPGKEINLYNFIAVFERNTLICQLPTKGHIIYNGAHLKTVERPDGRIQEQIRYYAVNKTLPRWRVKPTYGAAMTEHFISGTARDIVAHNIVRFKKYGYDYIASIHDEFITESRNPTKDEFEKIIMDLPEGLAGAPLAWETEILSRYQK